MERNDTATGATHARVDASFSRALLVGLPLAGLLWAGLALLIIR